MTPQSFTSWLAAMKAAGLSRSDADAGRQLGITPDTVVNYKKRGAPVAIALACRALLHRLEPYDCTR